MNTKIQTVLFTGKTHTTPSRREGAPAAMTASTSSSRPPAKPATKSGSRRFRIIRPRSSCSPAPGRPATPARSASWPRLRRWRSPPTCPSTSKWISSWPAMRTSSRPGSTSACRALRSTWQRPSRRQRTTSARTRKPFTATSTSPRTSLPRTPWRRDAPGGRFGFSLTHPGCRPAVQSCCTVENR